MYERRKERLLPRKGFAKRFAMHVGVAAVVLVGSLGVGMAGYAYFEGLSWLDAFLNASMLLGGMGPVESPATPAGKLFAGLYALYAGMIVLVVASIILAPVVHRVLHRFHWDDNDQARRRG
jgi:ABC-type glycerol-3-phosphate transport system permease component